MAALDTVTKYVDTSRTLLQDTVAPYRYPDVDLLNALNFAVLEARRLRPDLFLGRFTSLPSFTTVDSTAVDIDEQYRMAFVYYICGHVQLRDEEPTQDARAAGFLTKFVGQMLTIQA